MSRISTAFETLSVALSDASATLEKLRNGEIAPDQILSEYIKMRDRSDLNALYAEFKENFGPEGEAFVMEPCSSTELNGGLYDETEAREKGFYVGMKYSTPLMNYMMRRALDKENADKCYDLYIKGIDSIAETLGESADGHYPPKELIERITTMPLVGLSVLAGRKAEQSQNSSDIDHPDNTEFHI